MPNDAQIENDDGGVKPSNARRRWTQSEHLNAAIWWNNGKTASYIAKQLGRTRNSVIGHANRNSNFIFKDITSTILQDIKNELLQDPLLTGPEIAKKLGRSQSYVRIAISKNGGIRKFREEAIAAIIQKAKRNG